MPITGGDKGWGRTLEPGLRKVFFETYKEKPEQYSKVFTVDDSRKAIETDARFGAFSMWNTKGSQEATEYEDLTDGLEVQYKHTTFSKGFSIEKETYDDQQYNIIQKAPKALARAARATIESQAASVLNNAFTAASGVANINGTKEALIAMSHERLDGQTSDTQNMLTNNPVLSEANLELAMELSGEQVDERGLKLQMMPNLLVVPRALKYTAEKIVRSAQVPGSNWNDINPMMDQVQVVVLDYLSSTTCWFLIDTAMNPLQFFWREKLNFRGYDLDFDTDISKYKGRMRFSFGWSDWRGIIGSRGDGAA